MSEDRVAMLEEALAASRDTVRRLQTTIGDLRAQIDAVDRPLSAEEEQMIDAAWEKHKAAAPSAAAQRYREMMRQRAVKAGCSDVQADRVADEAVTRFCRVE